MIGDRIKQARIALGYSAEQVAAFLSVSPATVYRYENGDISKLPSKFIKPLAEYLCVSPSWLMGWSDTDIEQPAGYSLQSDEQRIVSSYRALSPRGKTLLLERAEELKLLYGKKSEDDPAVSV